MENQDQNHSTRNESQAPTLARELSAGERRLLFKTKEVPVFKNCEDCGASPLVYEVVTDSSGNLVAGLYQLVHDCPHLQVRIPFYAPEAERLLTAWNAGAWLRNRKVYPEGGWRAGEVSVIAAIPRDGLYKHQRQVLQEFTSTPTRSLEIQTQRANVPKVNPKLREILEAAVAYYKKTVGVGHSKALLSGTGYILGSPLRPVVVALHHSHGQALSPGNAVSLEEFPMWSLQNRRPLLWDNAPLHYLFDQVLSALERYDYLIAESRDEQEGLEGMLRTARIQLRKQALEIEGLQTKLAEAKILKPSLSVELASQAGHPVITDSEGGEL